MFVSNQDSALFQGQEKERFLLQIMLFSCLVNRTDRSNISSKTYLTVIDLVGKVDQLKVDHSALV